MSPTMCPQVSLAPRGHQRTNVDCLMFQGDQCGPVQVPRETGINLGDTGVLALPDTVSQGTSIACHGSPGERHDPPRVPWGPA